MSTKPRTKTEHPHIKFQRSAAGLEPHIRGTGISVRHIVGQYRNYGTVEGVLNAYPHLTPAQVHDALSYYYDHVAEIENFGQKNSEEAWLDKDYPNVVRRKV